ncbi:hypothetical protein D3C84_640100 [compost metagenome]
MPGGEIHRVGDQVVQGNVDGRRVDPHKADVVADIENQFKILAQQPGCQLNQAVANRGCQVNRYRRLRACLRLDTSHREQLIDQPAGTVNPGNQVLKRRTTLPFARRFHQVLRMHPEHGQWCAHFVGGIRDKTSLTSHDFLNLRKHTVKGCLHRLKLSRQRRQLQGFE